MCQGGNFAHCNGAGSESTCRERLEGENFVLASTEQYTNSPQFLICTARPEWLDSKHVGSGKLKEGMDITEAIRAASCSMNGRTSKRVTIANCGQL